MSGRDPYGLAEHIQPQRGAGCSWVGWMLAGLIVLALLAAAIVGLRP